MSDPGVLSVMSELVHYSRDDEVAVLTIDNPPVNALATPVMDGIRAAVEHASADYEVSSIVLAGAGKTFVAGADIQ